MPAVHENKDDHHCVNVSRYLLVNKSSRSISVGSALAVDLYDLGGRTVGATGRGPQHRIQGRTLGDGHHRGAPWCYLRKHRPVTPEHVCVQYLSL